MWCAWRPAGEHPAPEGRISHASGSARPGDPLFDEIFHPVAERLLARCDAVLRIGGPSEGADRMVAHARAQGKHIYIAAADVPAAEPRTLADVLAEPRHLRPAGNETEA